jgi:hypothetical protein
VQKSEVALGPSPCSVTLPDVQPPARSSDRKTPNLTLGGSTTARIVSGDALSATSKLLKEAHSHLLNESKVLIHSRSQENIPWAEFHKNGISPAINWLLSPTGAELCSAVNFIFKLPSLDAAHFGPTLSEFDKLAWNLHNELQLRSDDPTAADPLNMDAIESATERLQQIGLESLITERTNARKFRGFSRDQLAQLVSPLPNAAEILHLMSEGQQPMMLQDFVPNGLQSFRQSRSYSQGRNIIHSSINDMITANQVLAVRLDGVDSTQLKYCHANRLERVPKPGNDPEGKGRLTLNCSSLSKSGLSRWSLNSGTDITASDILYPPPSLPTVHSICELACQQRSRLPPNDHLDGATADVKSAYCQIPQSTASAMLHATKLFLKCGLQILVIYLTVIFGYTRAGHIYNVIGNAISKLHNLGLSINESETYVDDGIIICPSKKIHQSLQRYISIVKAFFGPDGISENKVVIFPQSLIAIGWHWDFSNDRWTVQPKERGLIKMHLLLFYIFPPECTASSDHRLFSRRTILKLAGLLNWYAVVIPSGPSFVLSLYRSAGFGDINAKVPLSDQAKADIEWWRALLVCGLVQPSRTSLCSSIDRLRINISFQWFLLTDASTSVGGGGWIVPNLHQFTSTSPELQFYTCDDQKPLREGYIRWTDSELSEFANLDGIINVLEFFVVIYYVILWSDMLQNTTTVIRCDNSAAISWISHHRSRGKLSAAFSLTRAFTIFCASKNIHLIPLHLAGVLNTHADFLSRDLSLQDLVGVQISSVKKDVLRTPHGSETSTINLPIKQSELLAQAWRQLFSTVLISPSMQLSPTQLVEQLNLL